MWVKWGLYEHLRNTADAMRTFLSRITPSRAVFRAILVHRDPWDNSEMIVRAWSLVTRLLAQTGFFWLRMSLSSLKNELIRCLRRESSPRASESAKNWSLWTEKCTRSMLMTLPTSWLPIFEIVLKPIHGYIVRPTVMNFKPSIYGLSVELSVKTIYLTIYLDLFRPYVSIVSRTVSFRVISGVKMWCQYPCIGLYPIWSHICQSIRQR